jgi:hypothetical protein
MPNMNEPGFNPARPKDIGPNYGRGNFQGAPGAGASPQQAGDDAMSAARDWGERAKDAAASTADALKTQASDLVSESRDKIVQTAQDQKRAGADYISGLAETIRSAANEFDQQVPFAANYIRSAASGVDNVADSVRNGDFSDLVTQTQNFARRQPTLFAGLSMLAGFGVVRLLKGAAPKMQGTAGMTASSSDVRRNQSNRGQI